MNILNPLPQNTSLNKPSSLGTNLPEQALINNAHKKEVERFTCTIKKKINPASNCLFKLSRIGSDLKHSIWVSYIDNQYNLLNVCHKEKPLGKGGYKIVKRLVDDKSKKEYALGKFKKFIPKIFKKQDFEFEKDCQQGHFLLPSQLYKVTKFKLKALQNGKHKYMPEYDYATLTEKYEGDLSILLNKKISNSTLLCIIYKMITSVNEFHSITGYVHRDIKINNWLIKFEEKKIQLKLIDYDFKLKLLDKGKKTKEVSWIGTPQYLPPNINFEEVIKVDRYHQKFIDYYALYTSICLAIESFPTSSVLDSQIEAFKQNLADKLSTIKETSPLDKLKQLPIPMDLLKKLDKIHTHLIRSACTISDPSPRARKGPPIKIK